MASPPIADASIYGDFAGLQTLKQAARKDDPAALREVARQFESLFARMLLKSMRQAIGSDPIFGSDQVKAYQQMYDDQLSIELTKGHGLGLADMLVRQLQRGRAGAQDGAADAGGAPPGQAGFAIEPRQRSFATEAPPRDFPIDRPRHGSFAVAPSRHAFPLAASPAAAPPSPASPAAAPPSPAPSAAIPAGAVPPAERRSFVHALLPQARRAAQALGVEPESLIAQAALETHWGRSIPQNGDGGSTNNLFGMKAGSGWGGPAATAATREFDDGTVRTAVARFRSYASPTQCFEDYVALIKGDPRYSNALGTGANVQAFASALQRGGYATDPDYASKLCEVAGDVSQMLSGAGAAKPSEAAAGVPAAAAGTLKSESAAPITGSADPLP